MKEGEEEEPHRATVRRRAAGSSSPPRQPPPPAPATHIHQLPDEVLAKIFTLLSLKTIVNVLSVCQRWQDVIADWYLNKELVLVSHTFSTEEALCLIRSARNLKFLELFRRSDAVVLLDAASSRCTNLLHLSVRWYNASVSALTNALLKVFHSCPNLTDVSLTHCHIYDTLRFYQELGTALPDLRKLEIDGSCFNSVELDAFIDSCHRNQMEELKACNCACSDENIAKLVQFWARSLRVLELGASNVTDAALAQLAGCSELRRLKLVGLNTPGDSLDGLTALSHLEDLDVTFASEVERENWCSFFSQSRSSHSLRNLSLRGCSKVDDGVLASVATFCPQLEELEASYINVTISGVREVLRCCRKLHHLHVDDTDASVAHIVPELPQLAPQLRRIRIGYDAKSALGDATLRCVQAQMPHLKIG